MAFVARRAFASSFGGARRVFAHHRLRASGVNHRPWGHDRIPSLGSFGARSYHGGYGGSSGQGWDGLIYSIMANIRGQAEFGPECFYSAMDLDDDSKERKDIRDLVPLRLNRPSLLAASRDISLRLRLLCKPEAHMPDYSAVEILVKMMERLAAMPSDNPKLELHEYMEIWMTIRDGVAAANDMPLQIISINESDELKRVKWNAECVWGIAMLNAALRKLKGTKVERLKDEDDEDAKVTFGGDLRSMAYKINGLLLDSKDFFPEGQRWFTQEQEEQILEAIVRVYAEAGKRRHM